MATYQLISSVTVGSGGASSIDFTSIPATYTDLLVKLSLRTAVSGAAQSVSMKINTSTANRTHREIEGSGSSAISTNGSDDWVGYAVGDTATASTFSNHEIYIPNYAGSTNKSLSVDAVNENNTTAALSNLIAGLWSQTAAITGLSFYATNNFKQYSTAYLYGIKNS